MTDKERQMIVRRIVGKTNKAYVVTHGTDTLIETAKYLKAQISKKIKTVF